MDNISNRQRIKIAKYYLDDMNLTLSEVAKIFNTSPSTVSTSLTYYLRIKRKIEEEVIEFDPDELSGVRDDSQRFERLIMWVDN